MIAACAQFLDQAIESARRMDAKVLADMKRSRSFAWRTVDAALRPLDDRTKQQVLHLIHDIDIGIVSKRDTNEWKDAVARYGTGTEYVHTIAEAAMESRCRVCDGGCQNECPIYESFVHFQVPIYDATHPKCEYSMVEVVLDGNEQVRKR